MSKKNNLLVAASGTGGHIFPALAVSKKVEKDWNLYWLGVQQRLAYEKCSVCSNCVNNNIHQLEKIFVDGKNEKGKWIDPAHKIEIPTCMCGDLQHLQSHNPSVH